MVSNKSFHGPATTVHDEILNRVVKISQAFRLQGVNVMGFDLTEENLKQTKRTSGQTLAVQ